jgi:anti-sigma28 factor (negative regulator of flagellin synthesis)
MVRKKVLQAQIELLIEEVNELMQLKDKVEELTKKIESKKYKFDEEQDDSSLFDEWMNGAKKEGEK